MAAASKISVSGLWKVYGPGAARIPEDPLVRGESAAQLRARTGCTAAVRNVSLEVGDGELFMVMGLSGSGKSTLIRCLTRLTEPTTGTVRIGELDVTAADAAHLRRLRRGTVAMVFQHFGLLPHRRVIDNVAYGLQVRGVPRVERRRRAGEMLDLVGLTDVADSFPRQLSGGMRQRVGLARALAVDPEVLVFDEPFSALDPLTRWDMQGEILRLRRELHTTMIFVTHDLPEALRLGDRIMVMRDGEAVQVATPEQLVTAPADDYVRRFVRDVPLADVVTLQGLSRRPAPDEPLDGPCLPAATQVRAAARTVLTADRPVRVMDGGDLLGVVTPADLLPALVGPAA